MRLNDAILIQVDQGKHQKRIEAALSSQTLHIAVEIASDKELCVRMRADPGLPVPEHRLVRDAAEAARAAQRIGSPVVVEAGPSKPMPWPSARQQRGGGKHDPGRRSPFWW